MKNSIKSLAILWILAHLFSCSGKLSGGQSNPSEAAENTEKMNYLLVEKTIYSEADLLHFGDRYESGEIANTYFPDYSGVPLGDAIFESDSLEKVQQEKVQREAKRLRNLEGAVNAFFDDDIFAEQFFGSDNFKRLQAFYQDNFQLELIRRSHNQMIVKDNDFYIPANATAEQMMKIQELLGLYFFEILPDQSGQ